MPQISLNIDDETLRRMHAAAEVEGVPLSEWVVSRIKASLTQTWPHDYESVFGAIEDPTFERPDQPAFDHDVPRDGM